MGLSIKICHDNGGTWSVQGTSPAQVSGLPSLSASIEYARKACNAAPATIELYVDGMYIVAHQDNGWPKAFVSSGTPAEPPARLDLGGAAPWNKLIAWLRGPRHLTTEASSTCLKEREVSNVAHLKQI